MPKITFMGAGSTVFAKNVLGDVMLTPALQGCEIALYDIDPQRLKDSEMMLNNINENYGGHATIKAYLGVESRKEALRGADFVVNAIQVGGYEPCTVTDFEIPKKYGLRQTIADTLGIGGIFRALRTIPVLKEFADDMAEVCPDAWFLNYTNPMAILTGALIRFGVKTVGLCHSVQGCVPGLLRPLGISTENVQWKIAGINHQAWLLEITRDGKDLYPEIKEKAFSRPTPHNDMVRYEIMKQFGYYVTESSEHNAEYVPWFIKSTHPELIERFNIPLDEYPRRCVNQIKGWEAMRKDLVENKNIEHHRTHEYASYIMEAIVTDKPYRIHGNVLNTGLITNLPYDAVVEVPCMVDRNGINPCYVGDLPQQCAAINRTNINVQLLTLEAAFTLKKDYIYMAAMMDPHTAAELTIDEIRAMCDDLIEAHGDWLPKFK
ncbi:alpha-glucosidase/alpha-galactosidase [Caldanaerobius polysaccharolyticus]|uniref:alpha-glucosidase/alpha-galactosidase n=1 Tax=Caldanaerobius polysaccharolyticus TaxID=44256 RepID=UPI00047D8E92|nr:alpha-glucosidase/alpha-galactosidase [Caldanaerobius polysaccharolyticus]